MKPTITWILVADSARARLFFNDGPGKGVKSVSDHVFQHPTPPGREIMSDRPGRTFDSVGGGRHAKEPRTDPRKVEKRSFAHELAAMLDDGLKQGKFERLVLVAPPGELGLLRAELSEAVQKRVSAELNKDLTGLTPSEIPDHLGDAIAI
jgi:protein required for attachment to host cells